MKISKISAALVATASLSTIGLGAMSASASSCDTSHYVTIHEVAPGGLNFSHLAAKDGVSYANVVKNDPKLAAKYGSKAVPKGVKYSVTKVVTVDVTCAPSGGSGGGGYSPPPPPAGPFKATTSINGQPDTTSADTGFYVDANHQVTTDQSLSVYGPAWAYDNLTETFVVLPIGNDGYVINEVVHGTFDAFSESNAATSSPITTGDLPDGGLLGETAGNEGGTFSGTNSFDVTSTVAPSGSLPATEPAGTSESALIPLLFPGGGVTTVNGGNVWIFNYTADDGTTMNQAYDISPQVQSNITGP
jgi:hypothetical protein